jgi:hypothetical protein
VLVRWAKLLNADCNWDPRELNAETMPENADCICDPKLWNALDSCENPVVNAYDIWLKNDCSDDPSCDAND